MHKDAFLTEIETDKSVTHTLASVVIIILTELEMEEFLQPNGADVMNSSIKSLNMKLRNKYELYFSKILNSEQGTSGNGGNKLRAYAEMKGAYKMELYLKCELPQKIY